MTNGRDGDGWDSFDFNAWGNGSESAGSDALGGHSANGSYGRGAANSEHDEDEEAIRGEGRWVSHGGVLHWEAPEGAEEADPRAEATSPWAAEEVELPPGAPDTARIRSAHAWLVRQRALEGEAQGALLLERRRQFGPLDEDDQSPRRGSQEDSPLDIALAEHQAAIEEYEGLIEALDEIVDHSGPARALVEYFLLLTERLADLARIPGAPADLVNRILPPLADEDAATARPAPMSPRAEAEWRARVEAVAHARLRVERVSAPEPED